MRTNQIVAGNGTVLSLIGMFACDHILSFIIDAKQTTSLF